MSILLTTFPAHKSGNVGDALITASTVAMIEERLPGYAPRVLFRETSLDELEVPPGTPVVAPGFSVAEASYPKLYRLYADLDKLNHFYPVGCSLQTDTRAEFAAEVRYTDSTQRVLRWMADRFGAFPCRDAFIVDVLNRHGIPALNCGDLAQYDSRYIGRPMAACQAPRSIAFTVGHHAEYAEQSLKVLYALQMAFPDAVIKVAFHGRPSPHARQIGEVAQRLGCQVLHVYGDVAELSQYDDVDLHVGYRLHGHIAFLRRRTPSILLIEDVRALGFSKNPGASVTAVPAYSGRFLESDTQAAEKVMELLKHHLQQGFVAYAGWLQWVDETYHDVIVPYFNNLARNLALEVPSQSPKLAALS